MMHGWEFLGNHYPIYDECECGCAETVGARGGSFGGLQRRKCAACGTVRKVAPIAREYRAPGERVSRVVPC